MSRRNTDAITIHSILDWIEDNLESPLSLEKVSERSGYSKWHLQRMFKKETGHSLIKYIIQERMYMARRLLQETTLSVNGIALEVGYSDYSHFTKTFRQMFGMTPSVYRQERETK